MVPDSLKIRRYSQHQARAVAISKEYAGDPLSLELEALGVLWVYAGDHDGPGFWKQAEQIIRERLQSIT